MITEQDRIKYPYHTDSSILGIKLMGGLTDLALEECIDEIREGVNEFDGKIITSICFLMDAGKGNERKTNPSWVLGAVLEEAYTRGIISTEEFSKLSDD